MDAVNRKCNKNRRSLNRNRRFLLAFFLLFCFYLSYEIASENDLTSISKKRRFNLRKHHFKFTHKMIEFFDIGENDASKVIWAHGVNSQLKLKKALVDETMVLEADIIYIENKHPGGPVMAHPPQQDSDITFKQWLNLSLTSGKALKLDFKTMNSIEPCLRLLNSLTDQIRVPVLLNADIWKGKGAKEVEINCSYFLKKALEYYPKGILSLGWTTFNDHLGSYSWENIYEAYDSLKKNNILSNNNIQITFAIRMQWAVNSVYRLIWLQKHTNCTFTIWSHATDKFTTETSDSSLTTNDRIYLFRYFLANHLIYYDLAPGLNSTELTIPKEIIQEKLKNSDDILVRSYLLDKFRFEPNLWSCLNENTIYESDYSTVMTKHSAEYISLKEYKAQDNLIIYEVHGAFELFEHNNTNEIKSNISSPNLTVQQQNNDDNNLAVDSQIKSNTVACVKISIRRSLKNQISIGSINFYIYMNGLVKIYIGNKMDQEANIQSSNKFEFSITDVGETKSVHFDLNSYDITTGQKYSLQMLVNANYYEGQQFYVSQTLIGSSHAIGVDSLRISDEISDPQDRDSNENQNHV